MNSTVIVCILVWSYVLLVKLIEGHNARKTLDRFYTEMKFYYGKLIEAINGEEDN